MAKCGHCFKEVKGIRDHIRDVHGFPFYCLGADLHHYYGKWAPPHEQVDDFPDEPIQWTPIDKIDYE